MATSDNIDDEKLEEEIEIADMEDEVERYRTLEELREADERERRQAMKDAM